MSQNAIQESKLKKIQGLGYKFENKIFINPRETRRIDLDEIALPDWNSFEVKISSK